MATATTTASDSEGDDVVYSKTIRLKNGKVLHASAYGLKAFRLVFKKKRKS